MKKLLLTGLLLLPTIAFGANAPASGPISKVKSAASRMAAYVSCLGSFMNLDSDTLYVDCVNNRVGVGVTTPVNKLSVAGAVGIGAGYTGYTGPTNGLLVQGAVGIAVGTTGPGTNKLSVGGSAAIGSAYVGATGPTDGLIVAGSVGIGTTSPGASLGVKNSDDSSTYNTVFVNDNGNAQARVTQDTNGNGAITVNQNGTTIGASINSLGASYFNGGSLAIGHVSPVNALSVAGAVGIGSGYTGYTGPTDGLLVQGAVGIAVGTTGPGTNKLSVGGSVAVGSAYVGATGPTDGMIVAGPVAIGGNSTYNNLYVGTAFPTQALVQFDNTGGADGDSRGLLIYAGSTDADYSLWLKDHAGNDKAYFRGDGNVGIGTTNPTSALHVVGAITPTLKTKANFDTLDPVAVGEMYLCSDCTIPYSLCVATGTAVAQWKQVYSGTVGCGTNE